MPEIKQVYSVKKIMLFAFGGGMLVFGLIGLVVPFLPGVPMIFIGLTCCTKGSKSFKNWNPVKKMVFLAKKHYPGICL